jgi:hypothetical protein
MFFVSATAGEHLLEMLQGVRPKLGESQRLRLRASPGAAASGAWSEA